MSDREVPYDPKLKCDNCGNVGAFDFMGDYFCDVCAYNITYVLEEDSGSRETDNFNDDYDDEYFDEEDRCYYDDPPTLKEFFEGLWELFKGLWK